MKHLRRLLWAIESTTPRNVSRSWRTGAAVTSFARWKSSNVRSMDEALKPVNRIKEKAAILHAQNDRLSQRMRDAMRLVPHPVVVVTTLGTPKDTAPYDPDVDVMVPRAMTVSSFTSLSIKPEPKVTFNVTLPSTTHTALLLFGKFNVHILSGDEHGARIAHLFTQGNRQEAHTGTSNAKLGVLAGLDEFGVKVLGRKEWEQELDQQHTQQRIRGATYLDDNGESEEDRGKLSSDREGIQAISPPLLQGKGILKVLRCEFDNQNSITLDSDDHAIVVGDVVGVVSGESGADGELALAYADRAYRQIGDTVLQGGSSTGQASKTDGSTGGSNK